MDSALRPRDIQARIRAGESIEDVARAAGVPAERIEAFASPVIAEREHVAGLAQIHPVRRRGETTSHRQLRNAVADALAHRGVASRDVRWDAWKLEDRRWQVTASYAVGSRTQEALFVYEQTGRFSTAANDDARALIGDEAPPARPTPKPAPTASPLVDDELAIVRALQSPATPPRLREVGASPASATDAEDAFHEGELAEVDGVYDIVPAEPSELDVLYDMLSSFDEDSVKIYAGLVHPAREDTGVVIAAPPGVALSAADPSEVVGPGEADPPAAVEPAPEADPEPEAEPEAEPDEPVQLSLIEDVPAPRPTPKPARRRGRASVPSWDEIMFGSPHSDR